MLLINAILWLNFMNAFTLVTKISTDPIIFREYYSYPISSTTSVTFNFAYNPSALSQPRSIAFLHSFTDMNNLIDQCLGIVVSHTASTYSTVVVGSCAISLYKLIFAIVYWSQQQTGVIHHGYSYVQPNPPYQLTDIQRDLTGNTILCFISRLRIQRRHIFQSIRLNITCEIDPTDNNMFGAKIYKNYTISLPNFKVSYLIFDSNLLRSYNYGFKAGTIESRDKSVGGSISASQFNLQQDDKNQLLTGISSFSVLNQFISFRLSKSDTEISTLYDYQYLVFTYIYFYPLHPFKASKIQYFQDTPKFHVQFQNVLFANSISKQKFIPTPTSIVSLKGIVERTSNSLKLEFEFRSSAFENASMSVALSWQQNGKKFSSKTFFDVQNLFFGCFEFKSNSDYLSKSELINNVVFYLQFAYLFVFGASLINSKMIGIEMMYFIQLSYLALLPVVNNPFIKSLTEMKFVNGYNPLFKGFVQGDISENYSLLKFSTNFLSNCNLMIGIILVPIFVSCFLFIAYSFNSHYRTKPILLKYAKSLMFELPLVLIIFSVPNFVISLVINLQSLGTRQILPLVVSFAMLILPLIGSIVYIFHKHKLNQFNEQLHNKNSIRPFSLQTSRSIRKSYLVVILVQMYLTTIVLAIQALSQYVLYILLAVNFVFGCYCVYIQPYSERSNNVRLVIQRGLFPIIITTLITIQMLSKKCYRTLDYFYITYAYISIISINLISSLVTIIIRFIKFTKTGTKIDHQLYLKTSCLPQKPKKITYESQKTMKKCQFGLGHRQVNDLMTKTRRSKQDVMNMLGFFKEQLLIVKNEKGENDCY